MMPRKNSRSKYGAKKTVVDGIKFDSQGEAARYRVLSALQRMGTISDLQTQVRYPLKCKGIAIKSAKGRQLVYTPDFVYKLNDETVYEDFKGMITGEAKLRISVFESLYKVKVKIVKNYREAV